MRSSHRLWRGHPLANSGTTTRRHGWADDPTQNDLLDAIHVVARHVTRQSAPQDTTQQSVAIGVVREPQGEGHSTQGPFAPMEQPCDREDASQRQQILGTGDPQTMTSALQSAFRHAGFGVQVRDQAWFDCTSEDETEYGRGGSGCPCFGSGEQSMDSFSVDVLEDGELEGADVTGVTLFHAGCGNRRLVPRGLHLGVGTRVLDQRRGVLRDARPLVSARSGRGADLVEIGVYDRRRAWVRRCESREFLPARSTRYWPDHRG